LWGEGAAQEVTLDDLWRRLLADRRMGLNVLAEHRLDEWSDGGSVGSLIASERTQLTPATCFEVLWGPLDGMLLEPGDGEIIGRWDPKGNSECGLYREAALTDRRLHRKHLRYLRRGRVELLYKTDVIPAGASWSKRVRDRRGELEVCVGDILCLTPATWLRAVGVER